VTRRRSHLAADEDENDYILDLEEEPSYDTGPDPDAREYFEQEALVVDDERSRGKPGRRKGNPGNRTYKKVRPVDPRLNKEYGLDPFIPREKKERKRWQPPPIDTLKLLGPLLPGLPETLIGPSKMNQPGVIHLTYFPIGPPVFAKPTPGWIVQALKEPNQPEAKQSSVVLSHFARMIKKPYALWLNEHLAEEGFDPDEIQTYLQYRTTKKDRPRKPGGKKPKVAGGKGWPLRWVSSTCIGWLIYQVGMIKPPFHGLRPMINDDERGSQWRNLYDTIRAKNAQICPMALNTDPQFMDRTVAEDLLGVRWSNSLTKIWSAWQLRKAKYDFRRHPAEDEPWATDMEDEVDNAFINLMARRFMQPPYHRITDDKHILTSGQIKLIFYIVNILVKQRAAIYLQDERREAVANGQTPTPWTDKEIQKRFLILREDLFNQRRIGVDAAKRAGLLERSLSGMFMAEAPRF